MSVDKELAQALEEAEAEGVPAVVTAGPEAPRPKAKRNLGLLVGLLAIISGVLVLVFSTGKDAAVYSVGVSKVVKEPTTYQARNLRVKGMLVKGSLMRRDDPCEYRFKLIDNGEVLSVQHPSCDVPDTFKDMPGMDVEVQAEGKLMADGKTFTSHRIIAKCPSKYEMKQRSLAGELAPHKTGEAAKPSEMETLGTQH